MELFLTITAAVALGVYIGRNPQKFFESVNQFLQGAIKGFFGFALVLIVWSIPLGLIYIFWIGLLGDKDPAKKGILYPKTLVAFTILAVGLIIGINEAINDIRKKGFSEAYRGWFRTSNILEFNKEQKSIIEKSNKKNRFLFLFYGIPPIILVVLSIFYGLLNYFFNR